MLSYNHAHVASPELLQWILGDAANDERVASVGQTYIPRLASLTPAEVASEIASLKSAISDAVDAALTWTSKSPAPSGADFPSESLGVASAALHKSGEAVARVKIEVEKASEATRKFLENRPQMSALAAALTKLQDLVDLPHLIETCAEQGSVEEAIDLIDFAKANRSVWPVSWLEESERCVEAAVLRMAETSGNSAASAMRVVSALRRLRREHDFVDARINALTKKLARLKLLCGDGETFMRRDVGDFLSQVALLFGGDFAACERVSLWLLADVVPWYLGQGGSGDALNKVGASLADVVEARRIMNEPAKATDAEPSTVKSVPVVAALPVTLAATPLEATTLNAVPAEAAPAEAVPAEAAPAEAAPAEAAPAEAQETAAQDATPTSNEAQSSIQEARLSE